MSAARPVLRAISPDASPEEVAAIVAAIAEVTRTTSVVVPTEEELHEWVRTARFTSRRAGLQRGPWRLSGRVGRRARP